MQTTSSFTVSGPQNIGDKLGMIYKINIIHRIIFVTKREGSEVTNY